MEEPIDTNSHTLKTEPLTSLSLVFLAKVAPCCSVHSVCLVTTIICLLVAEVQQSGKTSRPFHGAHEVLRSSD